VRHFYWVHILLECSHESNIHRYHQTRRELVDWLDRRSAWSQLSRRLSRWSFNLFARNVGRSARVRRIPVNRLIPTKIIHFADSREIFWIVLENFVRAFINSQHKLHWVLRGLVDASKFQVVYVKIHVGWRPFNTINMIFRRVDVQDIFKALIAQVWVVPCQNSVVNSRLTDADIATMNFKNPNFACSASKPIIQSAT
jgi:hypothetical protein